MSKLAQQLSLPRRPMFAIAPMPACETDRGVTQSNPVTEFKELSVITKSKRGGRRPGAGRKAIAGAAMTAAERKRKSRAAKQSAPNDCTDRRGVGPCRRPTGRRSEADPAQGC